MTSVSLRLSLSLCQMPHSLRRQLICLSLQIHQYGRLQCGAFTASNACILKKYHSQKPPLTVLASCSQIFLRLLKAHKTLPRSPDNLQF